MDIAIADSPESGCEEFVNRIPDGKIEHLLTWTLMIKETFGHTPLYLIACHGGQVHGVLPLFQIRSRLFGNRMVSQAFSNYGGALADDPRALDALYSRAFELAVEHGCESIEFRNLKPVPYEGLHLRNDKIIMYLPLTSDPEDLWRSFRPEVRNQVRKAEKSGLTAVSGGSELLRDFWDVWTIRMRQLGTPCYSRRLFHNIYDTFPKNTRVFLVRLHKLTVSGAFVYCFKGLVQIRWAANLVEYNKFCPNNLLYWSVMKYYCLAGASCFDFGRTTLGSTQHRFKKQWGAQPSQLHYQYWARPGHKLSVAKPDNPRYEKKVKLWKKLPLWMTRWAGPYISRSLG